MPNDISFTRRGLLAASLSGALIAALPRPAAALDDAQAKALVGQALAEIDATINSGKSETAMYGDFERIFARYADVPVIARSVLGPPAKTASAAQMSAFTKAYQGYLSRKYGRRFREFIGGRIEVTGAKPVKSYYEVVSVAYLKGEAPFDLRWYVSDKSGKNLFFNIIIEGVNMLSSERTEIGAMLDQNGGSIDKLIAQLNKS
ncbi:MAG: ABC transporter substrate-binding protein [Exiguobacterium profundum]|nr:MAG: ABC transporter substrate-binding protein [Exiguobacterium profundum]